MVMQTGGTGKGAENLLNIYPHIPDCPGLKCSQSALIV